MSGIVKNGWLEFLKSKRTENINTKAGLQHNVFHLPNRFLNIRGFPNSLFANCSNHKIDFSLQLFPRCFISYAAIYKSFAHSLVTILIYLLFG